MKPRTIGLVTMLAGAIGIIIPILVLCGDSNPMIQVGVLISGSILFGCGAIATVIGLGK